MKKQKEKKINIKRIDNEGNEVGFSSIKEAARSISTKKDDWVVQLYIVDAINNHTNAFKYRWVKVNK